MKAVCTFDRIYKKWEHKRLWYLTPQISLYRENRDGRYLYEFTICFMSWRFCVIWEGRRNKGMTDKFCKGCDNRIDEEE